MGDSHLDKMHTIIRLVLLTAFLATFSAASFDPVDRILFESNVQMDEAVTDGSGSGDGTDETIYTFDDTTDDESSGDGSASGSGDAVEGAVEDAAEAAAEDAVEDAVEESDESGSGDAGTTTDD